MTLFFYLSHSDHSKIIWANMGQMLAPLFVSYTEVPTVFTVDLLIQVTELD